MRAPESPARVNPARWEEIDRRVWLRMAAKAQRERLRAYRLNDDPRHWVVTSARHPDVAYEVTLLDGALFCSCPASSYFPYCKHRALVLQHLGWLTVEASASPEPANRS